MTKQELLDYLSENWVMVRNSKTCFEHKKGRVRAYIREDHVGISVKDHFKYFTHRGNYYFDMLSVHKGELIAVEEFS